MKYLETRIAAVIFNIGERALQVSAERGSPKYKAITIKGNGRGGKKLLIGVSDDDLMEALRSGVIDENIDLYDDCGMLCSMEERNTLISNSKEKKEVVSAVVIAPDMKPYLNASPKQKTRALMKMDLVVAYENRDRRLSAKELIHSVLSEFREIDPSPGKLFRWKGIVDEARKSGISPVVALLDKRGREAGRVSMNEEMQEMAKRMFARPDNPLRVSAIYQNMLHRYGDAMVSYDVLNNFIKKWKRLDHSFYAFAQSPDKWKNNYLAAFGKLDEKAKFPNEWWELDSTPADIICSDGKRYAIIGMIDIYSRRVTFWVDERSSSYSIARLMRKAILKMGIPENVVIDNGKDYKSEHFKSITHNLGIEAHPVPPFSGDAKGIIERMFRTLSSELFEELYGYIGHNVAERSDIQARRGFEHKLESQAKWREEMRRAEKKEFVDKLKIKKENKGAEVKLAITPEKLQEVIDGWVDHIYEKKVHSGTDEKPIERYKSKDGSPFQPKGVGDPMILDLLLGESFVRKVGKSGIRLDGCEYVANALAEYVGHEVRVMTTPDMGVIAVYKMNHEPICTAEDTLYTGTPRAEFVEGKRISKRIAREYSRILEQWNELSHRSDPSILDRIEAAASKIAPSLPATFAMAKSTEVIRAVKDGMKVFAQQDAVSAENSNIVNMDGEKLLPSGRPLFKSRSDRLIWDIENDMFDESSNMLAKESPEEYATALKEIERRKIG